MKFHRSIRAFYDSRSGFSEKNYTFFRGRRCCRKNLRLRHKNTVYLTHFFEDDDEENIDEEIEHIKKGINYNNNGTHIKERIINLIKKLGF